MTAIYNWKAFFAEIMNLSLGDVQYLSVLDEIPEDDKETSDEEYLLNFFESIENDEKESDIKRLTALILRRALSAYMEEIEECGEEDDEKDSNESVDYHCLSVAQQNKREENLRKKYSSWTFDQVMAHVSDYVWKEYPMLADGFSQDLMRNAKERFWQHGGVDDKYSVGWQFVNKVDEAFRQIEKNVKDRFAERVGKEAETWAAEYIRWYIENGVRCSKSSLKTFLKDRGIRANNDALTKVMVCVKRQEQANDRFQSVCAEEQVSIWEPLFRQWADVHHVKYTKQSIKIFFKEKNMRVTELVAEGLKNKLKQKSE